MNNIKLFTFLAVMACAVACSSKADNVVVTPQDCSLSGELKDYYNVVDKEYTIAKGSGFISNNLITVELKRTDTDLPFGDTPVSGYGTTRYDVDSYYKVGFGIELLDESGNVIVKKGATATGLGGVYSDDDVVELADMASGEQGSVRWSFEDDEVKNAKSFRILSSYKSASGSSSGGSSADSDDSSSESSVSSSGSSDMDALIDSYEEYVTDYIKLMKKAQAGDMTAMTEYPALLENAQDLQNKLNKSQGDMSTAQAARFSRIITKMASAASAM